MTVHKNYVNTTLNPPSEICTVSIQDRLGNKTEEVPYRYGEHRQAFSGKVWELRQALSGNERYIALFDGLDLQTARVVVMSASLLWDSSDPHEFTEQDAALVYELNAV